jgi:peptide deformylase
MAVRRVLQLGDPLLREVADAVPDPAAPEVAAAAADLADTLAHWRATTGYGRAIAAPQIGVLQRIVFLNVPGMERPLTLVNPVITGRSEAVEVVWDACLSFLSIFMRVPRHREIRVRFRDLEGAEHEIDAGAEHDLAELLQHEIDHLDGILAIDRVTDVRSIVAREEFERRFRAGSPYAATGADAG